MGEGESIFKKIMRVCIRTGLIALILLVALFAIQKVKHPNQVPSLFGYQPLTVLSNSMQPSFNTGDLLFIKKSRPPRFVQMMLLHFMWTKLDE